MPTAASWTEARRAVQDVGHLIRFRSRTIRRPRALVTGASVFFGLTVGAAVIPSFVEGAGTSTGYSLDAIVILPAAMAGLLALAIASAIASGGGRELLSREHAVAFPVSPTTDHLGALLLAPLNIAWLIQAWVLLGATSYGVERGALLPAQIGMVVWIATATALGQVAAWSVEAVRRTPRGILAVRAGGLTLGAVAVAIQLTGNTATILDSLRTSWLVVGFVDGFSWRWAASVGLELGVLLLAVVVGAVPAHIAARRAPRDEVKIETGNHEARPLPRSAFAALLRTDRGSVWRAVPMRRGVAVLAIGPGLVALAGDLTWSQMTILPGLVASGGALLFGVNAWCLDHRGGLWRESLPVGAATVFAARAWVLAEFLLIASFTTMVLAGLRAGVPTTAELSALLVHVDRGGAAGRLGGDALVVASAVRGGPALRARHAGTADRDGGLLDEAGRRHDHDQPDLLRTGTDRCLAAVSARRHAVRRLVCRPTPSCSRRLGGACAPGPRRDYRGCLTD